MTAPRTTKRSRSGAAVPCPHCGKKLRGSKGLKAHVVEKHLTLPSGAVIPIHPEPVPFELVNQFDHFPEGA